jgi:pantoate--beta-alanine ligase
MNNKGSLMPLIFKSFQEWKQFKKAHLSQKSIGFVPTMGNLHRGHLSLCAESQKQNDVTVVSIFVNPTQFNETSDFECYPRTLEADIELLKQQNVDYLILPQQEEVYADQFSYQVSEHQIATQLEGEYRPGHFTGMLTIVMKLLMGVGAIRAYFGEKDYQQYLLIKGMVKSFFMDCEIIACPIIREDSLLPFSSRNSRLNVNERIIADTVAKIFNQLSVSLDEIRLELLHLGVEIDYLEERFNRRLMAVRVGAIRLLDNYAIN